LSRPRLARHNAGGVGAAGCARQGAGEGITAPAWPSHPDRLGLSQAHQPHARESARAQNVTSQRSAAAWLHPRYVLVAVAMGHEPDLRSIHQPRRSPAGLGRLVDRAPAFGPILERAEVVDLLVAHVFEHLAAQGRAAARGAIENDGFVLGEILIVV